MDKINQRQWANKKILETLEPYIKQYPGLRFCQLLEALHVIPRQDQRSFNEESVDTLNKLSHFR